MALRSRSRTTTATSGPGRGPASDGRARHRRPADRNPAGHRPVPGEELRRRAELLFAERAVQRRESGHGPPGARPRADTANATGTAPTVPGTPSAGAGRVAYTGRAARAGQAADAGRAAGPPAPGRRERAALALRERLPVWLQARCGLERRGAVALTVVLALAAVLAVQHFWAGRTQSVSAPQVVRAEAPYETSGNRAGGKTGAKLWEKPGEQPGGSESGAGRPGGSAGAAPGTAGAEIVVDVSGKVRDPGIHRLPAGSRVADALRAAGGPRPGTSTEGLNRARFLVDGEQIVVGAPAQAPPPAPGAGGPAGPYPAGPAAGAAPTAPIPLSTATAEQLDTLPGVGPVLARRIIDYRTQHGGFRSVDELRQVNGVGARRFADLRNLVRP
ncbi:helix-hairpin-helix domain-containing protein [Streptomyces sp. NPDC006739]|uniref:helix-hairpin-helix domain-containing protein n=1 Tax=Streptomyces sp. NPDC006739 TaxID=3364763 RepID=UPI0036C819F8